MRAYTKESGCHRSRSSAHRWESRWRMRRDHRVPRDQAMRRWEVGAARAEGRRICAEELEAWATAGQQAAPNMKDLQPYQRDMLRRLLRMQINPHVRRYR